MLNGKIPSVNTVRRVKITQNVKVEDAGPSQGKEGRFSQALINVPKNPKKEDMISSNTNIIGASIVMG